MQRRDIRGQKVGRAEAVLRLLEENCARWLEQARKVLTFPPAQLVSGDYTSAKLLFQELQVMCVAIGEGIDEKEERSLGDAIALQSTVFPEGKGPDAVARSLLRSMVFLLCSDDRTRLRNLVEALEVKVRELHLSATIGLYGVSVKQHNGFIVLVSDSAPSATLRSWFDMQEDVLEYVVYSGEVDLRNPGFPDDKTTS